MSLLSSTSAVVFDAVGTSASFTHARDLETVIQDEFRSIPQVEGVSVDHEDGTVFVWIAVNNPVKALRYDIYAKQMNLIEAFPEVTFDFNLISGT